MPTAAQEAAKRRRKALCTRGTGAGAFRARWRLYTLTPPQVRVETKRQLPHTLGGGGEGEEATIVGLGARVEERIRLVSTTLKTSVSLSCTPAHFCPPPYLFRKSIHPPRRSTPPGNTRGGVVSQQQDETKGERNETKRKDENPWRRGKPAVEFMW